MASKNDKLALSPEEKKAKEVYDKEIARANNAYKKKLAKYDKKYGRRARLYLNDVNTVLDENENWLAMNNDQFKQAFQQALNKQFKQAFQQALNKISQNNGGHHLTQAENLAIDRFNQINIGAQQVLNNDMLSMDENTFNSFYNNLIKTALMQMKNYNHQ